MSIVKEIERIISEKETELRACNSKIGEYKKKMADEAENFRLLEKSISDLKSELAGVKNDSNVSVF